MQWELQQTKTDLAKVKAELEYVKVGYGRLSFVRVQFVPRTHIHNFFCPCFLFLIKLCCPPRPLGGNAELGTDKVQSFAGHG